MKCLTVIHKVLEIESSHETIKTTPNEAATSLRGLTKSTTEATKRRKVSMARPDRIRNHSFSERVCALPPGEWQVRGGVRHFVAAPQPVAHTKQPKVAACGTKAGYNRHRRAGEDACLDCRRAARDLTRAKRMRAAAQKWVAA